MRICPETILTSGGNKNILNSQLKKCFHCWPAFEYGMGVYSVYTWMGEKDSVRTIFCVYPLPWSSKNNNKKKHIHNMENFLSVQQLNFAFCLLYKRIKTLESCARFVYVGWECEKIYSDNARRVDIWKGILYENYKCKHMKLYLNKVFLLFVLLFLDYFR